MSSVSDEFSFISRDGTEYICKLLDIIELDKHQRAKIKTRAARMTDEEIRTHGVQVSLTQKQERTVVARINQITSKWSPVQLLKLLVFNPHAVQRMGDPDRSLRSKLEVAEILKSKILVNRCRIQVKSPIGQKPVQMNSKLSYTVESPKPARLAISIRQSQKGKDYILIITVLTG